MYPNSKILDKPEIKKKIKSMNIKQSLTKATKNLSHLENHSLEAEVLLSVLLKKNRTWLKTYPETNLTTEEQTQFSKWIEQRAKHVPVAYITGIVDWNGLTLNVNQHTLIPRDETETLCHHILEAQITPPHTILDVGTGSGCIAIWLAKQFLKANVVALDISKEALEVARKNAETHSNINLLESDLLQKIEAESHFDLIVANLPYVPEDLIVTAEVDQEPRSAIFSGSDGLDHIRELAEQLISKKITFNQLWLEFLPSQTKDIQKIFAKHNPTFLTDVGDAIYFGRIKPR